MKERARKACIRYLQLKGWTVLESNYEDFVIYADEDMYIHFVDVSISDDLGKHITDKSRDDFEQAMAMYLADNIELVDVPLCPDICNLVVVGSDRAFVRHYINVQEELSK